MNQPAPAASLAAQLEAHGAGIEEAYARLQRLVTGLETGDQYAIDHADEQIGWIADALRGTTRLLESVRRYTVTGAARIERIYTSAEAALAAMPEPAPRHRADLVDPKRSAELVREGSRAITEVGNQ